MSAKSIAESFALMGPSHVLDQQMHQQTMNLVMFARHQALGGNFIKSNKRGWNSFKMKTRYNKDFEKWDDEKDQELYEFLTDAGIVREAHKEMRGIRATIRRWAGDGVRSISSQKKDLQKVTVVSKPPQTPIQEPQVPTSTPQPASIPFTPAQVTTNSDLTPLTISSLTKALHDIEKKFTSEVDHVRSTVTKKIKRYQISSNQPLKIEPLIP